MNRRLLVLIVVLAIPCGVVADTITVNTVTANPTGFGGQFRYDCTATASQGWTVSTLRLYAKNLGTQAQYDNGGRIPYAGAQPDTFYDFIPIQGGTPGALPAPANYDCWAVLKTFNMQTLQFRYTTSATVQNQNLPF